ncbi:radical SAM-linked protein [Chthonomonas calidirosea]|uniref:Radical SAM-linked protein n=1 Tax=Chthonomonas calidirosea (strain DSM 23976 / ICMP 18418 / T49) TaxID=1303518 RepID=S0EXD6_CHTCT|nr:TIGR03936 family radical SAM-associated protein [Chthonomonas calidirosea]CCW36132.1 radical SAM-linked protein [Chthonomonas calidirosea T49]CEK18243.1 radical SAM-linked protein [Chthonomonas calidirosea]
MPRYILFFTKEEPVRWLGHLDILRTFERAIRRSGLPIAFSGGFNPRERLSFASALGVGITGAEERVALELTEPIPPQEVQKQLNAVLPPGIRIVQCFPVSEEQQERNLFSELDRADYEVLCSASEPVSAEAIEQAIAHLLSQSQVTIPREREGKTRLVDIKPQLYSLQLKPGSLQNGRFLLIMRLGMGETGNVRPNEVIEALGQQVPGIKVHRIHRLRLLGPDS